MLRSWLDRLRRFDPRASKKVAYEFHILLGPLEVQHDLHFKLTCVLSVCKHTPLRGLHINVSGRLILGYGLHDAFIMYALTNIVGKT